MKVKIAAMIVLALVLLASCNNGILHEMMTPRVFTVKLPDGRSVICLDDGTGGLSCDWRNAK